MKSASAYPRRRPRWMGRRYRDRPEASDSLPRRRQGTGRQGNELRRASRRGRPGRAWRALRRRGRRRARFPRHHGIPRSARHDRRAGAADGRQRLHPVHDRRRHPVSRGRTSSPRCRCGQGRGQLGGGRAARADLGAGRDLRRAVRCAGDRREARTVDELRGVRERRPRCRPVATLSPGRARARSAGRGRSCSRAWTATAPKTATSSSSRGRLPMPSTSR